MNVYDSSHQLARAIKDSQEYKEFKRLEDEISSIPELKSMISDLRQKQLEIQSQQLMGKEIDEEKIKKLQELFEIINKDPKAGEYFQAEMRYSQMMSDVSKILSDAMSL